MRRCFAVRALVPIRGRRTKRGKSGLDWAAVRTAGASIAPPCDDLGLPSEVADSFMGGISLIPR